LSADPSILALGTEPAALGKTAKIDGSAFLGALLLFRVDSQAEADEIVAADPYYSGPGVTVVSLKEWNPVALAAELG
jgi:uncharacterized protein YciI